LRSEFVAHDADAAMDTMVPDACVNHVPTMTGGVGHDEVKRFYKYHFVNAHPPDIEIIPVSRTVGTDSIVDEMIVKFTHTCVIDHLLPGIPPTGRSVEIPVVGVVQLRDGKLASEHIYWDQASVLVQIGKLDPTGLPIAGVEVARKGRDGLSERPGWRATRRCDFRCARVPAPGIPAPDAAASRLPPPRTARPRSGKHRDRRQTVRPRREGARQRPADRFSAAGASGDQDAGRLDRKSTP